jgi:magnesium-transporting ATPase (P-type)
MSLLQSGTDNKALQDLRDELKDLNINLKKTIKSNEKFTWILLAVAVLQLIVGFFQFIADLFGPVSYTVGIIVELLLGGVCIWAIHYILPSRKEIKENAEN